MRNVLHIARVLLILSLMCSSWRQSVGVEVLDQVHARSTFQPSIGTIVASFSQPAQTFTVGQAGVLSRVDLAINVSDTAIGDLVFALQSTTGGVPDTGEPLYTTPIPLDSINDVPFEDDFSLSVDVGAANHFVQPGDILAWTLDRPSGDVSGVFVLEGGDDYLGGKSFRRSFSTASWSEHDGSDRFFRTYVDTNQTSGSVTINPSVTANVALEGGSYVLETNPSTLFTQQLPISDIDSRTVLEFPLGSLPEDGTLTSATLHLDVNVRSYLEDEFPNVPVFGYSGNGFATTNDASVTTNLIGASGPIIENAPLDIVLDPAYIAQLRDTGSQLGIVMVGDANGNQAGFDNFTTNPTLEIEFDLGLGGDYNDDGVVDAADYTVWRDNLGAPAGTLTNDVDGGTVSSAQYATWKANFGRSRDGNASLASAVVPEPATWLSAIAALGVAMGRRWIGDGGSLLGD